MKKLNRMLTKMEIKARCAIAGFKNSERGDTNFVSMLLIIGIVVVLAGAFLALAKDTVFEGIKTSVDGFMKSLGGK